MTKARDLAELIGNSLIDGDEIATGAVGTSNLASTLDFSSKTMVMANDQLSGDKVHGGTISGFTSTGIDDNATANILTVSDATPLLIKKAGLTTAAQVFLKLENNAGGGAGAGSSIDFHHYHAGGGPAGGEKAASITAQNTATWPGGTPSSYSTGLTFGTLHENTFAERMRIHSSGQVGIGETGTPDALLHLKGGTATDNKSHILFENTQGSKTFAIGGGADGVTNNNLFFRNVTDDTRPMVITDAGRVGIGIDSPDNKLHVHSGNSSDIARFANDNGLFVLGKTANLGSLDMASDASFRIRHGSVTSATFKSGGNVLIGTTTDDGTNKLQVSGTVNISNTLTANSLSIPSQGLIFNQAFGTGVPSITMTGTVNNGRAGAINFKESDGVGGGIANTAAIYSTDGAGGNANYGGLTLAAYQSDIRFSTVTLDGTKAIIKADGKVGIGVTDPATKLEVSGAVQDIETSIANQSSNQWFKIGTVFGLYQGGSNIHIQFKMHSGYNAANYQDYNVELFMKTSNGSSTNASGGSLINSWWYKTGNSGADPRFKWKDIGTNNYELFMWVPAFGGNSSYTVKKSAGRWFPDGAINQSDPGADSSTVLEAENRLGIYSDTTINGTLKVTQAGGFYNNGVREYSQYIDNLVNDANVNFDVPVTRTGSGYTVYYECMYNHFGNTSYGSWRSGFFSFRSDNNNTYYDDVIKNHGSSSTGGGGWTVTLINPNTATPSIRFNKNAGTYVGSGDGHIFIRGGAL